MAVASTETLLSLDRYAQIMGISPVHFNNLQDGVATSVYGNQYDHEALAVAIAQAEAMLAERLGFDVAPRYQSEIIAMPRTHRRDWWNMRVKLPHAYVQQLGSASWQLVEADAPVVLDSEYGTVTISGDLVTVDEYALFYCIADGAPSAQHEGWRIQTSDVTFTEGDPDTLVLTAFRERFSSVDTLTGTQPADLAIDDSLISAVDVYALVVSNELPVTLHWDSLWETTEPDNNDDQTGAGRLVDSQQGRIQVRAATYDSTASKHVWAAPRYADKPERFTAVYQAGYPLGDDGRINPQLEMAAVRLANTLMPDMGHRFNDVASTRWYNDRKADEDSGLPYGTAFAMTVANTLAVQ